MTDFNPDTLPITIPANPAVPTSWAALRVVVLAVMAALVGAGWVKQETANSVTSNLDILVPAIGLVLTAGLGLWRTYRSAHKAAIAGEAAPNKVAVVK